MTVATKFNAVQMHLLQMFERINSEKQLEDLKSVLSTFYAQKVDEMSEQIWEEKQLSDEDMDNLLHPHLCKQSA